MFVAVEHFNDRRGDLVPDLAALALCNKHLEIVEYCDSAGNPLRAANSAVHLVENKNVHIILGPTGVDDGYAMLRYLDSKGHIPAVSHFVSALELSNKRQFPNFVRSIPSDADAAFAMSNLIKQLGLTSVGLLGLSDTTGIVQELQGYLAADSISLSATIFGYDNLNQSIYQAVEKVATFGLNTIVINTWAAQWPFVADAMAAYGLLTPEHTIVFGFSERVPTPEELADHPNLVNMFNNSLRLMNRVDQNPNFKRVQDAWESQTVNNINPMLPPKGTQSDLSCANSNFNAQLPADFFQTSQHLANEINAYVYDAVLAMGFALCDLSPSASTGIPNGTEFVRHWASPEFGFSGLSTERFRFNPQTLDPNVNDSNYKIVNYFFRPETGLLLRERLVGNWTVEGEFQLAKPEFSLRGGVGVMPTTSTPPYHDQHLLPDGLRGLAFALFAVLGVFEVACALWLLRHRKTRLVINSQPVLMWLILLGCSIASLSLITLVSDDSGRDAIDPSIGCMLTPALFLVGGSIAVLAICSKTYRIQNLFVNPKLRHIQYTTKEAVKLVVLGMVPPVAVLVAWWVESPLVFARVLQRQDVHGEPVESYSMCEARDSVSAAMLILMLIFYGAYLGYAVLLANRVRDVPTEYHESKWINFAVASLAQIYFLALPTVAAVYLQVVGRFILLMLISFSSVFILLLCIFGSKISAVSLGRDLMPKWMIERLQAGSESSKNKSSKANGLVVSSPLSSPRVVDQTETRVHLATRDSAMMTGAL